MCGITAYKGKEDACSIVFDGLKKLEYRGYDSWGMAWQKDGKIRLVKDTGKVSDMARAPPACSTVAIAHTRWATHGKVEKRNAHPLLSNSAGLAVVHNGIIENSPSLKRYLSKKGFSFGSDTDTEVIPNLVEHYLSKTHDLQKSFYQALLRLDGSYAIVLLDSVSSTICFARKGSPLCMGLQDNGTFLASDTAAFLGKTKRVIYLQDKEYGFIGSGGITLKKMGSDKILKKKPVTIGTGPQNLGKGNFPHFMLKEIFEQPAVIEETLSGMTGGKFAAFDKLEIPRSYLKDLKKIVMIGCGTAHYAGIASGYLIESLAGIEAAADFAGEFKYSNTPIGKDTLYIFISQSGETAETIDAQRKAKLAGAKTLSVINVAGSALARESDYVLYTKAGPEICVASTKVFTSQLMTMALFALWLADLRKTSQSHAAKLLSELPTLAKKAESTITGNVDAIKDCAKGLKGTQSMLFIGRGISYPIALEGALKLKETSYLHAEGMPAGELKHGPLAMVDENTPVVCIAPYSATYHKTLGNIQEIKARKGRVIAIATKGDQEIGKLADYAFYIPKADELLSPFLTVIILQLLSYYISLERGCDIDKPRNLAKSVTVE